MGRLCPAVPRVASVQLSYPAQYHPCTYKMSACSPRRQHCPAERSAHTTTRRHATVKAVFRFRCWLHIIRSLSSSVGDLLRVLRGCLAFASCHDVEVSGGQTRVLGFCTPGQARVFEDALATYANRRALGGFSVNSTVAILRTP